MSRGTAWIAFLVVFGCRPAAVEDTSGETDPVDTEEPDPVDTDPPADVDGDGYDASEDCDDANAAVFPGQTEVCNGGDDDCDDAIDEGVTIEVWTDADGDGFGAGAPAPACSATTGLSTEDGDCNDADGAVSPGASEVWYDGVDANCDGKDDYDQDGDGDRASAHGGGDCADDDATRQTANGCRPTSACSHPSASTLAANDVPGVSDLAFDATCKAYLPQIVNYDAIQVMDGAGATTTTIATYGGNFNITAVALDPTGGVWALANDNASAMVGVAQANALSLVKATTYTSGTSFSDFYLNQCGSSLAHDGTCAYAPNTPANGALACVQADGTTTNVTTLPDRVEGVAVVPTGDLYASAGSSVYLVDGTTGPTVVATLPATVLDFVVDFDGTLYVETTGDVILRVATDGTSTPFATVAGDGKLAISPDGWLVRLIPVPLGSSTYQEWQLAP